MPQIISTISRGKVPIAKKPRNDCVSRLFAIGAMCPADQRATGTISPTISSRMAPYLATILTSLPLTYSSLIILLPSIAAAIFGSALAAAIAAV